VKRLYVREANIYEASSQVHAVAVGQDLESAASTVKSEVVPSGDRASPDGELQQVEGTTLSQVPPDGTANDYSSLQFPAAGENVVIRTPSPALDDSHSLAVNMNVYEDPSTTKPVAQLNLPRRGPFSTDVSDLLERLEYNQQRASADRKLPVSIWEKVAESMQRPVTGPDDEDYRYLDLNKLTVLLSEVDEFNVVRYLIDLAQLCGLPDEISKFHLKPLLYASEMRSTN
jgi:hypothetical protein